MTELEWWHWVLVAIYAAPGALWFWWIVRQGQNDVWWARPGMGEYIISIFAGAVFGTPLLALLIVVAVKQSRPAPQRQKE